MSSDDDVYDCDEDYEFDESENEDDEVDDGVDRDDESDDDDEQLVSGHDEKKYNSFGTPNIYEKTTLISMRIQILSNSTSKSNPSFLPKTIYNKLYHKYKTKPNQLIVRVAEEEWNRGYLAQKYEIMRLNKQVL